MDPNANLEEQLRLAQRMLDVYDRHNDNGADGARLAELVEALDAWLAKGGFLPERWQR